MTKIYEALDNAQRGRKGLERPEVLSSDGPIIPSFHPPIASLDMEEEMISLHHSIESVLLEPRKKIIQFIGSTEGEGTSTIVREFARVSALRFGETVLLMDADPYGPARSLFFNQKPGCGWNEVVQKGDPIDKALYQIENTSLFVTPVSRTSVPAYQTFDSPEMLTFLEEVRKRFDLVLIDSSPANTSPDGLGLSQKVDGIVLVVEAEKTRWPVVESVKERITKRGGKILGIVLNKRRYHILNFIYRFIRLFSG
jgi:Mrp family chromosome partitioning ATPase